MSKETKNNRFLKVVTSLGLAIYNLFLLQILWIFYSLKGFLFLGIFPAGVSVANILYNWFDEDKRNTIASDFKETYSSKFKKSNQLGYIFLLVFVILYIDLRISNIFIQSIIVHTLLLFLTLLAVSVTVYGFVVIVRYNYSSLKNILRQSFFIALSVPIYTVAALVGLILVSYLLYNYVFLFLFFGIPLFLIPIVWFTYKGALKAEQKKMDLDQQ